MENQCHQRLQQNLAIYRHENLRHRENGVTPECINTELSIPYVMREMLEKLINEEERRSDDKDARALH